MNKPEVIESGLPSPGLLPQAIAFVRDFAAFAGIRGRRCGGARRCRRKL